MLMKLRQLLPFLLFLTKIALLQPRLMLFLQFLKRKEKKRKEKKRKEKTEQRSDQVEENLTRRILQLKVDTTALWRKLGDVRETCLSKYLKGSQPQQCRKMLNTRVFWKGKRQKSAELYYSPAESFRQRRTLTIKLESHQDTLELAKITALPRENRYFDRWKRQSWAKVSKIEKEYQ